MIMVRGCSVDPEAPHVRVSALDFSEANLKVGMWLLHRGIVAVVIVQGFQRTLVG